MSSPQEIYGTNVSSKSAGGGAYLAVASFPCNLRGIACPTNAKMEPEETSLAGLSEIVREVNRSAVIYSIGGVSGVAEFRNSCVA